MTEDQATSILAYTKALHPTGRRIVIGLHGFDEDHEEGLRYAQALDPESHAYAPGSPRPVSPRFHNALENEQVLHGKLWFIERDGYVEPSMFGDNLRQVEAFLRDTIARDARADDVPLSIVGRGQGGTLALLMGAIWPELVDQVVAIDANLPVVPGWSMPERDLSGLEVHLVRTRSLPDPKATKTTLQQLGADVTETELEEGVAIEAALSGLAR